jgi:hypothetical protein
MKAKNLLDPCMLSMSVKDWLMIPSSPKGGNFSLYNTLNVCVCVCVFQ